MLNTPQESDPDNPEHGRLHRTKDIASLTREKEDKTPKS
jgi:hypothetical protein